MKDNTLPPQKFSLSSGYYTKSPLPGARVRNSAHGKGHEEGGFGICKGGIEPQETLFPSIYPQNQSLPTLLFYALTYTSDFTGG